MEKENVYIDGAISVKAVIENESRPVFGLYISEKKLGDKNTRYIISQAKKKGINPEIVSADFFENDIFGKTNGGIAAEVGKRKLSNAEDLLSGRSPFLALIEGVEDPYNFGSALRSLAAAGATGIILPQRNWLSAAGTVIKSSAGASEKLPAAVPEDIGSFLKEAKKKGFEIIAAERKNAVSLFETDLTSPLLLAVGGEKRGLSKKVSDEVTKNVFIPYGSDFRNALGTAAATAVFAFEILRQRESKCTQ